MIRRCLLPLAAMASVAAQPALAQSASPRPMQSALGVQPMLDVTGPRPFLVLRNTQPEALRGAGIVQTSLGRRLGRDGADASVGFLCGLQPGQNEQGAAAVRGYDPQGRFLGAKLRFSF